MKIIGHFLHILLIRELQSLLKGIYSFPIQFHYKIQRVGRRKIASNEYEGQLSHLHSAKNSNLYLIHINISTQKQALTLDSSQATTTKIYTYKHIYIHRYNDRHPPHKRSTHIHMKMIQKEWKRLGIWKVQIRHLYSQFCAFLFNFSLGICDFVILSFALPSFRTFITNIKGISIYIETKWIIPVFED